MISAMSCTSYGDDDSDADTSSGSLKRKADDSDDNSSESKKVKKGDETVPYALNMLAEEAEKAKGAVILLKLSRETTTPEKGTSDISSDNKPKTMTEYLRDLIDFEKVKQLKLPPEAKNYENHNNHKFHNITIRCLQAFNKKYISSIQFKCVTCTVGRDVITFSIPTQHWNAILKEGKNTTLEELYAFRKAMPIIKRK